MGEHRLRCSERGGVPAEDVLADRLEAQAAERRGDAREAEVDDLGREADRFDDLGAPVRVERGDTHLRHDLEEPVLDRTEVTVLRFVRLDVAAETTVQSEVDDRFEREARADGIGAVGQEARDVMRLARFVGVHDDAHRGAKAPFEEPVMDRAGGERGRDRSAALVERAIGNDQVRLARIDRGDGLVSQAPAGPFEPGRAIGHVEGRIQDRPPASINVSTASGNSRKDEYSRSCAAPAFSRRRWSRGPSLVLSDMTCRSRR